MFFNFVRVGDAIHWLRCTHQLIELGIRKRLHNQRAAYVSQFVMQACSGVLWRNLYWLG